MEVGVKIKFWKGRLCSCERIPEFSTIKKRKGKNINEMIGYKTGKCQKAEKKSSIPGRKSKMGSAQDHPLIQSKVKHKTKGNGKLERAKDSRNKRNKKN